MDFGDLVPTVVPKTPSTRLTVTYASKKDVEMGQELTPEEVKNSPKVGWEADPSRYYTLLMIDPDAPSRNKPMFGQVNHWLVVNILGGDIASGEVKAEYTGAGPPRGTGLHRYVFLVFEQRDKLEFDEPLATTGGKRMNFSVERFMKKYGFERPYAGCYFKSKWDPSVNQRHNFCFLLCLGCFLRLCCVIKPCSEEE